MENIRKVYVNYNVDSLTVYNNDGNIEKTVLYISNNDGNITNKITISDGKITVEDAKEKDWITDYGMIRTED